MMLVCKGLRPDQKNGVTVTSNGRFRGNVGRGGGGNSDIITVEP